MSRTKKTKLAPALGPPGEPQGAAQGDLILDSYRGSQAGLERLVLRPVFSSSNSREQIKNELHQGDESGVPWRAARIRPGWSHIGLLLELARGSRQGVPEGIPD